MPLTLKKEKLEAVYARFETDTEEYRKNAICKSGCAFCCTGVGNVDITTLEGLIIFDRINNLSQKQKVKIKTNIARNRKEKEKKDIARCPFLKGDNSCLIYDIRPFSCRQLYSLEECQGRGPTIHRQAVEMAKAAVKEIQQIDDNGYSGHITNILHLLNNAKFRKFYLSGGFDPVSIMDFGKSHGILINRMVSGK